MAVLLTMLCTVLVAGPARADASAYEVVVQQTPAQWCPGETRRIPVTLRNTGTRSWSAANKDRVSYHWRDAQGRTVKRDGLRTDFGKDQTVVPGAAVEVRVKVTAPSVAGDYVLVWRMLTEGEGWFPEPPADVSAAVTVKGTGDPFAWSYRADGLDDVLDDLGAKETTTVTLQVTNAGCATWSAQDGDRMSYRWFSQDGSVRVADGRRTAFGRSVRPGEQLEVELELAGPPQPGEYQLRISPIRERVAWFDPPRSGAELVHADVRSAALQWDLVEATWPSRIAAAEVIEIPIVLQNAGTQPWSGALGDRVSYHWIGDDGRRIEGMRTPMTVDVPPGDRVALSLKIRAPASPGVYTLKVEPLRERVAWWGPPRRRPADGGENPRITIDPQSLAWELVALREPELVLAGRSDVYTVVVRNVGSEAWDPALDDRISYEVLDPLTRERVAHGQRTALPRRVEPGEQIRLEMKFDTPRVAGDFIVSIGMLREHVRWFHVESAPELKLRVHWTSTMLLLGGCVVLAIGAALRWSSPRGRQWARAAAPYLWPAWTTAQIATLCVLFSDLSQFVLWDGAGWISFGLAAGTGAAVALVASPRRRATLAVALVSLWTLIALVDLSYAGFFGGLAPLTAVLAVHHLWDAHATVGSTLQPSFAWLAWVPASSVLVLALTFGLADDRRAVAPRRGRLRLAALLGLGGVLATAHLISEVTGDLGVRVFSEARNAQRFGLVGAHLFQALRLARDVGGGPLSEAEEAQVFATLAEIRESRPSDGWGVAAGANLVIVQVEAMQAWAVDAEIDGEPVMPFLASRKTQGLFWDRIYDQTAQGRTSDAEYLVLGSGHALDSGALAFLRASNDFRTNIHALRDKGYATYSAHPYQRGFWNRSAIHPRYGFDRSEFRDAYGDGARVGWGLSDGAFLEQFGERIAALPEPFAAFAITLSLHHPYDDFPPGLRQIEMGKLEGSWEANYLHAMRHADTALASLQAELEARGLAERTVVLVYGDHVTGMRPTETVVELAHEVWTPHLRARMGTVPGFLWGPGVRPALSQAALGGQNDLGVTALHLLGVSPPAAAVGSPLVGAGPSVVALPDGGAVGADRMLIRGGLLVPPEGRCVSLPEETVLDRAACADIESDALTQLEAARAVLNHDLYQAAEAQR